MPLILLSIGLAQPLQAQEKGDPKAGKTIFDNNCVACHGFAGKGDGAGVSGLNPKPRDLTNGSYINALSDQYLFDVIKNGGWGVKKSPLMPAWGHALRDKEIWNLVTYIRSLAGEKNTK